MDNGGAADDRETAKLDAPTVASGIDDPDRTTPYIGTYLYPDDADDDHRFALPPQRRSALWLPLIIFVALLVTGGLIGYYMLPQPAPVSAPSARATVPAVGAGPTASAAATASLPAVATPPARPADALAGWATKVSPVAGIPVVAVEAYGYAQLVLQSSAPTCHLDWTTLAGIGEVASDHGRAGGATLLDSGRSTPLLYGPVQDGKSGRELVPDTDAGAFDGDATYDRALGPLQLMPSVWASFATDADADGIQDPFDIDDAALAVGRMLCAGGDDLSQLTGWTAAIGRYHPGAAFAKSVFSAADTYGKQTKTVG